MYMWVFTSPGIWLIEDCMLINNAIPKHCSRDLVTKTPILFRHPVIHMFLYPIHRRMTLTLLFLISYTRKLLGVYSISPPIPDQTLPMLCLLWHSTTNFREIHCTAVKRILKYLRGTTDYALCYSSDNTAPNSLVAYTDADYAGDLNDRKSRSGSILLLNNGPVIWLSRKQPCTATSTTESEYVAASLTSKEAVWARRLLADIGFNQQVPTPLYSDNQSAIRLVQNPEFHKRTKHIDVVFHLIR
jgi:hypothetical protein